MKEMKYESATPLYQQVYDILYEKIKNGEYEMGSRIPSEDKLCSIYHVSRVTVRAALKKLVEQGILTKMHGRGTFVSQPVFHESTSAQGSFTDSCEQMGIVQTTKVIAAEMLSFSSEIQNILDIEDDSQGVRVTRVRKVDGIPAIFEIDYFSNRHRYMLMADVENQRMRDVIFHNSGLRVKKYKDTFDIQPADRMQAKWLNCSINMPLLCVHQVVYDDVHQVLYYNEQYIRSDIYKYVIEQ